MKKQELFKKLSSKEKIKNYINIVNTSELVSYLFEIIESTNIEKYQAEKVIRMLSEIKPQLLYPYFDRMTRLLNSSNRFIRYGFILSMPNLFKVDICNKWILVKENYINFLNSTELIEFCNTAKIIPKFLEIHPKEEKYMIPILINIDKHIFLNKGSRSKECNDIAKSAIMDTFYKIYSRTSYKKEIMKFVYKNRKNRKSQIRNKVNKFLKKYDKED